MENGNEKIDEICATQRSCIEWCRKNKLISSTMKCEECKNDMKLEITEETDGEIWICTGKDCKSKRLIREDSFLEYTQQSFPNILRIVYFWAKGMSIEDVVESIKVERDEIKGFYSYFDESIDNDLEKKTFESIIGLLARF